MKSLAIAILVALGGCKNDGTAQGTENTQPSVKFSQAQQTITIPRSEVEAVRGFLGRFLEMEAEARENEVSDAIQLLGKFGENPKTRFWFEMLRGDATLKVYEEGRRTGTLTVADVTDLQQRMNDVPDRP